MFVCNFGIIVLLTVLGNSNGQELCQGSCIRIYECSPILELLKKPHLSSIDQLVLKNSQCGYVGDDPKVCCPRNMQMTRSSLIPSMDTSMPSKETPKLSFSPPDVTNHPKLKLINSRICGPITQQKIFHGNKTSLLEFPWMAILAYNIDGKRTNFKCGGTLINKRYVLTAAHCVTGLNSGVILAGVRIGDHDLTREIDCEIENGVTIFCTNRSQNFFIESVHWHDGYSQKEQENDIALIRMNGDADFESVNIRPICLPTGNFATLQSKKAIVTGWGKTESRFRSEVLLQVKLEIVPNEMCAKIYERNRIQISDKQICAGGKNRMDSCTGDSGGPLQYPVDNSFEPPKYVQYGLVSFGPENCGFEGHPGVYTKISYYMDWILDTIVE